MQDYKGYYDYKVEVFKGEKLLGVFGYVTNLSFLSIWLNINPFYLGWDSIQVYHRLTGTPIGTYKRGSDIPSKPKG